MPFVPKIIHANMQKTARRINFLPFMRDFRLHHATHRYVYDVVDGELLAADVEGIESVGAVGAVFKQVLF
jgi:hypothetical protein